MKKYILVAASLLLSSISFTQGKADKHFIDANNFTESQMGNIDDIAPKDGWVLIKYKGENYIQNFSNQDYIFSLSIKCSEAGQKPGYLIEFSKNYRDKEWGGIDFLSSSNMTYAKVEFYLDGVNFNDPFSNTKGFTDFYQALKGAKTLSIKVYDNQANPDTGKEELGLNRSVDFKLGNSEILETPVRCE